MKRILQIGMTANYGGVESFIMNLYKNINRDRFQFDFVNMECGGKELAYTDEIMNLGGKIYKIPGRRENISENRRQLAKIINSGNYAFIDNNILSWSYAYGISIPIKYSTGKVIVHSHQNGIDKKKVLRRILNLVNQKYNNRDIIRLACGQEAGHWLFKNRKFTVVPNGIDTELYRFNSDVRQDYRDKFNIGNGKVFLNVGRLSHQKNHYYLINLFAKILKVQPDSYLYLVGDGELHSELVEYVKRLHLDSRIIFLGTRHDVPSLMQMSDCFLFPSYYEGLPIALIEAQASGLPCLVSNKISKEIFITPYIHEMNIDISPDNYVSKAINLSQLEINRKIGPNYIKKANYDIKNTVAMMEKIYSNEYSFN